MKIEFQQTSAFIQERERIELYLYNSVLEIEKEENKALESVQNFADAFDRLMDTLEQMYSEPDKGDSEGVKSFPIREGRYRVFYKIVLDSSKNMKIIFLDIDDNKQSNLDRFPEHNIITFNEED